MRIRGLSVVLGVLAGWAAVPPSHAVVRFLVPQSLSPSGAEREIGRLVDEYNARNPDAPVELLLRGGDYTTLRETLSARLAGSVVDIAAIEPSEAEALESIAKPVAVGDRRLRELLGGRPAWSRSGGRAIPFLRVLPLLFVDLEACRRAGIKDAERAFGSWERVLEARRVLGVASLGVPATGSRGLWALEALSPFGLWTKERGGLRARRELVPVLTSLRRLWSAGGVTEGEGWERLLEGFAGRKTPMVVGFSDWIPSVAARAEFAWRVFPLPSVGGRSVTLVSGSDLVVWRDSPEVWRFLRFLYAPENAARWAAAGAFAPLHSRWVAQRAWKSGSAAWANYPKLVERGGAARFRSSDREVVRARSEWIQALPQLLARTGGDAPPVEEVLTALDQRINERASQHP